MTVRRATAARRIPRTHMAGVIMRYAGRSAFCWKWPKQIKDPESYSMYWVHVDCKRCLAMKPEDQ